MHACKHGHKYVVQLLLDHANPSIELKARNSNGMNTFIWAWQNGHTDVRLGCS